MFTQALVTVFNSHLSWLIFAVSCGTAGVGVGFLCGRYSMVYAANDMLQLALERAARDIRLFRENRVGEVPNGAAYRLLMEAEYMVAWRATGDNHLTKPTGESRMRPPGVPRSRVARLDQERRRRRNQITAFAFINRGDSDDTGAMSRSDRINRRYST